MNKYVLLFSFFAIHFLLPQGHASPSYPYSDTISVKGRVSKSTTDSVRLDGRRTALDKEGNFRFQVPLKKASYLELQVGKATITLFAEPGKDIFVSFDESKVEKTIRFKGKNAEVNQFMFDQQAVSKSFNGYFNKNVNAYLYKLPEQAFVQIMDSLQATFLDPLQKLHARKPELSQAFVRAYKTEIELIFLSFLADYPLLHQKNTGNTVVLGEESQKKLAAIDFNDSSLHQYDGFKGLLKNFLYQEINQELKKSNYATSDNKRLDAGFAVIKRAFTSQEVFDKVLYDFFLNHIENLGIKNIENNLAFFNAQVRNEEYKEKINRHYAEAYQQRQGHLIRTYKEIDGYKLDAHIFMPDSLVKGKKYPAIAMFHGGSFHEGKPDWFFSSCKEYASQGWVAVAVEYRVASRHGNLLPEAIADGKSLLRFLREHAEELQVDTSKIMVTGNSSGATIGLALATLDGTLDEPRENQEISSRPNALMINAGLADLTGYGHYWWHKHYERKFIERISPLQQLKEGLPPMLIVHGSKDNSVDVEFIRQYAEKSKELGNKVHFVELEGAPHLIWLIPYFARQINQHRQDFLEELDWN